jgi:hypothetical protein
MPLSGLWIAALTRGFKTLDVAVFRHLPVLFTFLKPANGVRDTMEHG